MNDKIWNIMKKALEKSKRLSKDSFKSPIYKLFNRPENQGFDKNMIFLVTC